MLAKKKKQHSTQKKSHDGWFNRQFGGFNPMKPPSLDITDGFPLTRWVDLPGPFGLNGLEQHNALRSLPRCHIDVHLCGSWGMWFWFGDLEKMDEHGMVPSFLGLIWVDDVAAHGNPWIKLAFWPLWPADHSVDFSLAKLHRARAVCPPRSPEESRRNHMNDIPCLNGGGGSPHPCLFFEIKPGHAQSRTPLTERT